MPSLARDRNAIAAAGTAAFFAAEAAAGAAFVTAAEAAEELLTPFEARYLSTSGGRLGSTATRKQLYEIAKGFTKSDEFEVFAGDGEGPEEYIFGGGPGTKGSTYVDFTAVRANGTAVRVQTIDTLADGVTPTLREALAAARIRLARPFDELRLIPKVRR